MLTIKCPSKLNLNLRVIKKRSDGMHDIESRFQLINLYDEIRIKRNKSKNNSIKTTLGNSLNNKNNIVFSAIEALQNYTNIDIFCEIFIKKNIPVSGGMGGGSSNAAAALVGINNLYSLNLSPLELMKIGKKLGADVPFFLFGKNAIAQ
jgi:4-diphosphocytidyl-2-C-methyl-D-erythritol kinase